MVKKKIRRRRRRSLRVSSRLLWSLLILVLLVYAAYVVRSLLRPDSFRCSEPSESEATYPVGSVRGIDISHYQVDIDWQRVRNATIQGAPVSFVFIKATEGIDRLDPNFNLNFHRARQNGLLRGAYHFFSTHSSALAQARYFCRIVQLDAGDLPPVLDVEISVDGDSTYSAAHLRDEVLVWLRHVEQYYGVRPILYCSHTYRQHYLSTPAFDPYPFWIAHYDVPSLHHCGPWAFWQHTDHGRVDGISGSVDINLFNGTLQQLQDMCLE